MNSESRSQIGTLFCENGFQLSSQQLDQFIYYLQQLQIWNRKINLTRIDDVDGIVRKHFLDSLQLLELKWVQAMLVDRQSGCRLIDIGSGAGFRKVSIYFYSIVWDCRGFFIDFIDVCVCVLIMLFMIFEYAHRVCVELQYNLVGFPFLFDVIALHMCLSEFI